MDQGRPYRWRQINNRFVLLDSAEAMMRALPRRAMVPQYRLPAAEALMEQPPEFVYRILFSINDRELERRGHRFARYADDCNIYVRSRRQANA